MAWNYSAKMEGPHAKVVGRSLPVSTKQAIEVCTHIRGRSVAQAKRMLESLIKLQTPIPFKRAVRDVGHKRGAMATGRFPRKAGAEVLTLIKSAEANAQNLGLSTQDLYIAHIASQQASRSFKPGRQGRRQNKSTHIELILKEGIPTKGVKKEKPKRAAKKAPKAEATA